MKHVMPIIKGTVVIVCGAITAIVGGAMGMSVTAMIAHLIVDGF